MSDDEKTFPAPRPRRKDAPYRQAAPPAPSAPVDIVEAPVPSEKPLDVFEELQRVEIDPRVLEEARSSNRSWGSVMIAFGLFLIIISIAMDVSMWTSYAQWRYFSLPGIGFILVVYGIRRWRLRGIEY
jgi:uncharacterized membrane protein YcjF (UPF0283 family)